MFERFGLFIYIVFFCVSLSAQPSERFRWDPYLVTLLPQYQIFMGQLPYFLTPRDIIYIINRETGISVRITRHNISEGYAFLRVDREEDRQRILQFHHRIWSRPDVYGVLPEPDSVGTFVLEIPRHEQATVSHGGLW